ncbi:MAG TPA: hypothetical protein VGX49_05140 [Jatrophihabitans sp.]|jgi:hypothetical protein|nr:hypothetical protein [Jatrophihabitans sp.]
MAETKGSFRTDSGAGLLWDAAAFSGVNDYDSWSEQLEEEADIQRHLEAGHIVPLNILQDMTAGFVVRTGRAGGRVRKAVDAGLTERERKYLVTSSGQPYLFVSTGRAYVSGLEHVSGSVKNGERFLTPVDIPASRWACMVYLIDWEAEPGMVVNDRPHPDALPDFVVTVNPAASGRTYRTDFESFDPTPE